MGNNEQKLTIELTREQFLALLKAVYLGNWMANANRVKNLKKDYEEIEDIIFSYAAEFGFERYMDHEPGDGNKYYPTRYFEEETDVSELHEDYDFESMWEELADCLGERDFEARYSKEEREKMGRDERFEKLSECVDCYLEEFSKFGLERMGIKKV